MIRLRDLKERKVVQWLAAYLAAAWALVQVSDVVGTRFALPEVWVRILIVVLSVGAVAVLVLAWYHGEQGAQSVSTVELGMLTALLVIAGVAVAWVRPDPPTESPPPPVAADSPNSVAVLPFVNMSDSKENEYFADGVTEEILSALGRNHGLRVISRTSVTQYKGTNKSLREIAGELGVGMVLEGSVRRSGSKVRVTAQLIDAQTDEHLWAEDYDRELTDIFAIQIDIAKHISEALRTALTPLEQAGMTAGRTSDIAAYDLYLSARRAYELAPDLEGHRRAAALYHEALEVDSAYALAYVGLAGLYASMSLLAGAAWQDSAYAAARKAVALAPQLAEAHVVLGELHRAFGRIGDAEAALRIAFRLDPNSSEALLGMAFIMKDRGDLEEALRWALRATRVDPSDHAAPSIVGVVYHQAGDYQKAEQWYRTSLHRLPEGNDWVIALLVNSYLEQGLADRAERELEAWRGSPGFRLQAGARIALRRGQFPLALQLYEKAEREWHTSDDLPPSGYVELAYIYARSGDRAKAERELRESETEARKQLASRESSHAHVELARICAMRGDPDCALQELQLGAQGNWHNATPARNDLTLESLRADPEFQRILARVDAKGAAMRERLARIAS